MGERMGVWVNGWVCGNFEMCVCVNGWMEWIVDRCVGEWIGVWVNG